MSGSKVLKKVDMPSVIRSSSTSYVIGVNSGVPHRPEIVYSTMPVMTSVTSTVNIP